MPQFIRDLKNERARQTIFQIRSDKPAYMTKIMPDRTLQQIALQCHERLGGEKIIEPGDSFLIQMEAAHDLVIVGARLDSAARNFRRASYIYGLVVIFPQGLCEGI